MDLVPLKIELAWKKWGGTAGGCFGVYHQGCLLSTVLPRKSSHLEASDHSEK